MKMRYTGKLFIYCLLLSTILMFSACNGSSHEDIKEASIDTAALSTVNHFDKNTEESKIEYYELSELTDVELIALITMAEAESECNFGKRLVIDTVLNRVDSEHFPDSVHDVIYQPNQFASVWNGRIHKCLVLKNICEMVEEEMQNRSNYDCVFFNPGGFSNYGSPMFQVDNLYFSSYDTYYGLYE